MILIFIAGRERLVEQGGRVAIGCPPQRLVAGIISPWRNRMFDGGRRNIMNMMWMKIIDKSLI
jgi:hypothetical protein